MEVLQKKVWTRPLVLERRSVAQAQATKIRALTEFSVTINGVVVLNGPAS